MADSLVTWVAQRTYDGLLALTSSRPQPALRRASRRALEKMRERLVKLAGDPEIRRPYLGHPITFPLSHSLLLYEAAHATYGRNLARIAAAAVVKYPGLHAVDIGGNIGDSVLMLREGGEFPILTIEGDPRFVRVLERNVLSLSDVVIESCFVGTGETDAMTVLRSGGTSRLEFREGKSDSVRAVPLADVLARHPPFLASKLLKLDLDGLDFAVLEASLAWLADARPVVFLEYDPALAAAHGLDGPQTLEALRSVGYTRALVWDDHGNFLLGASLDDRELLLDLDRYIGSPCGLCYWDICCLHAQDEDLFAALRSVEAARQARP